MVFGGFQKLTLLDYPEKTACTVFTTGCNFNCSFCQNSSLRKEDLKEQLPDEGRANNGSPVINGSKTINGSQAIKSSEILDFLKSRQGLIDGVCISGGEPLMHDDLGDFINDIKALGFLVKLDTNGSFPQRLEKLITAGMLDHVAMDVKNTPEKYTETIGLPGYDISPVEESMSILRSCTVPYEFRTTVVREFHTGDDLLSIARWVSGQSIPGPDISGQIIPGQEITELSVSGRCCYKNVKYYLQEFVDSEGVRQKGLHGYSVEEMQQFLVEIRKILPDAELRGL